MFDPKSLADVPWLADLLDKPDDAAWPRWMSPVHPDAVGSYGAEVEQWVAREMGIEWRWWQRLATRRQLEHDQDGRLVWETVVESTPRRGGKSTRIVGLVTHRLSTPEIWGEVQTCIHTGSDVAICREIQRRAWRWAEDSAGWTVTRSNGKEAMETPTGDRWLVRSQQSVYGYDCSLGIVDEGWDVDPGTVDEGLEPALLEREMPQLHLTSTAHRKATPLMRRRIEAAKVGLGDDFSTLLMVWAADPTEPLGQEATWRSASPHWSEQRRKMIAGKYERAMRGEADPEASDPDPVEGFKAQYLNIWPSPASGKPATGEPVVTEDAWQAINSFKPDTPVVAAVEDWFGQVCVVTAQQLDGDMIGVSSKGFPDVSSAAAYATGCGAPRVLAGKTLCNGPLANAEPQMMYTRAAMLALRRMLDDDLLVHDSSETLTEQVLAMRVVSGTDGARLVSKTPANAVKAAVYAVEAVRSGMAPSVIW